jgi:hypothetical protein
MLHSYNNAQEQFKLTGLKQNGFISSYETDRT